MDNDLPSGVAVDFGGTKISALRLRKGIPVGELRAETRADASVEAQLSAILELLDRLAPPADEPIGIAVSGRVDAAGGWHRVNERTLSRVSRVPLAQSLSRALGRPVHVENDALAAAIGEHRFGSGRGLGDMAYLTVSTGVGGGFILNGSPLRSANGLAGHVGFTTSRIAKRVCGSGRRQTMESVASGTALAALAAEAGHPGLTGREVYEANLAGAEWAADLVGASASAVAELCANIKAALGIEHIVLGGSVGLAEGYLDRVRAALTEEPPLFRATVALAELGASSAHYGVLSKDLPARM